MADLIVLNWSAADGFIDVQNVEKQLPVGAIPRFALEGAGRLRMRAQGSYDANGATGTVTARLYTSSNYITGGGAGSVAWTSAGLSVPSPATAGLIHWELELIPLPQTDNTFKQWIHSVLTVKPDGAALKLEEWTLVSIALTDTIDFYGSLVNSSPTPLARICAVEGRISPPRSGS